MTKRIVLLDAYTINPGDLSWNDLKVLGDCQVYDRTAPKDVLERAKDAEILLTNKTILDGEIIRSLPNLRYIGVMATGYNVVDIEAARVKNIVVTNVPAYGTAAVAQATFALLLELTNQIGYYNRTVHEGRWVKSTDFCYVDTPLIELSGLNMGILGFGTIGKSVAKLAQAFGMKILVYANKPINLSREGIEFVDLQELFSRADVISLHCSLTPETREIINAEHLALMKSSSFLINTGRGQLIDEIALADALKNGRIAGAGLDVLSVEPPGYDNPLLHCPNCIITPHIAWATQSARQRLLSTSISNLKSYLSGKPVHVVT